MKYSITSLLCWLFFAHGTSGQVTIKITEEANLQGTGQTSIITDNLVNSGRLVLASGQVMVSGNWESSGTFLSGTSTVAFNGNIAQSLNHQIGCFHNLLMNTDGQINLTQSISIAGDAYFLKGHLTTLKTDTVFLSGTSQLINESNESYIKGNVRVSHTFGNVSNFGNIGVRLDAKGQTLGQTSITRTAGLQEQEVSYGVSSSDPDIRSIDRIWTISTAYDPTEEVTLTFNWLPADNNNIDNLSALQVWEKHDSEWIGTEQFEDGNDYEVTVSTANLTQFTIGPNLKVLFMALFEADSVCFGNSTKFKDHSKTYGNGLSYFWDFNSDGVVDDMTIGSVNYTYKDNGTFTATLIVSNDQGKVDSLTQTVEVYSLPEVDAGPDITLALGESFTFNPEVSEDAESFNWIPSDYLDNPSIKNTTSTPLNSINYVLKVTNEHGCSNEDEVSIEIEEIFIPSGFTPDGDGTNDTWGIPNKYSFEEASISVYDRKGHLLFRGQGDAQWDGKYADRKAPSGTYYYIIDLGNGLPRLKGEVSIIRIN